MEDSIKEFVFLGQSILCCKTPKPVLDEINSTYEKLIKKKKLLSMENQLAGKIRNEHSLFWNSKDENIMKRHNFLSEITLNFFKEKTIHYLKCNRIKEYKYKINSIWINEMKAGEYNPVHNHRGDLLTGLSSVMLLKLPKNYGEEWAKKDLPFNGQLSFIGNNKGCFCKDGYQPTNLQVGDFFLFPYDIAHCVYPFKGKEKRRTLSANIDVAYDSATENKA